MADSLLKTFSLSNILRQFFCGVVFFVPFFCISGTTKNTRVHSLSEWVQGGFFNQDWSTPKVAMLCVLACIVGTIIYHLEKNLWSYPLQCLYERTFNETVHTRDKDKEVEHNGVLPITFLVGSLVSFIVLFVIVLVRFKSAPDWVSKFYPLLAGGLFLPYLLILLACLLCKEMKCNTIVMRRTRAMWVMEELSAAAIQQFASIQDAKDSITHCPSHRDALACAAVAKRLASWSDYIHSVQCMCIAWLLGVGCVVGTVAIGNADIQHVSLLWISVFFSIGIIFLEAAFEYHRYCHLVYITAHFYRIHSSLDSLCQNQNSPQK